MQLSSFLRLFLRGSFTSIFFFFFSPLFFDLLRFLESTYTSMFLEGLDAWGQSILPWPQLRQETSTRKHERKKKREKSFFFTFLFFSSFVSFFLPRKSSSRASVMDLSANRLSKVEAPDAIEGEDSTTEKAEKNYLSPKILKYSLLRKDKHSSLPEKKKKESKNKLIKAR